MHCEPQNSIAVGDLAPRAWSAIQQLCGGQHRVHEPYWCDKFIINFGMEKDLPWQSPDEMARAGTGGWHADGWHFKHFLDSPGVNTYPIHRAVNLRPHLYNCACVTRASVALDRAVVRCADTARWNIHCARIGWSHR